MVPIAGDFFARNSGAANRFSSAGMRARRRFGFAAARTTHPEDFRIRKRLQELAEVMKFGLFKDGS
jgi:hypothetical protein